MGQFANASMCVVRRCGRWQIFNDETTEQRSYGVNFVWWISTHCNMLNDQTTPFYCSSFLMIRYHGYRNSVYEHIATQNICMLCLINSMLLSLLEITVGCSAKIENIFLVGQNVQAEYCILELSIPQHCSTLGYLMCCVQSISCSIYLNMCMCLRV